MAHTCGLLHIIYLYLTNLGKACHNKTIFCKLKRKCVTIECRRRYHHLITEIEKEILHSLLFRHILFFFSEMNQKKRLRQKDKKRVAKT